MHNSPIPDFSEFVYVNMGRALVASMKNPLPKDYIIVSAHGNDECKSMSLFVLDKETNETRASFFFFFDDDLICSSVKKYMEMYKYIGELFEEDENPMMPLSKWEEIYYASYHCWIERFS